MAETQTPDVHVVAIDDDSDIIRLYGILKRGSAPLGVTTFLDQRGSSQISALVEAVRTTLDQGKRVVVLSDADMPVETPLTVADALQGAGLLATRGALMQWVESVDVERPEGVPVLVVSGGISDHDLRVQVNEGLASGNLIGVAEKPFTLSELKALILALATAERDKLRVTLDGLQQTI